MRSMLKIRAKTTILKVPETVIVKVKGGIPSNDGPASLIFNNCKLHGKKVTFMLVANGSFC